MSGFLVSGGVARIDDPGLYAEWQDRPDYLEALAAAGDPVVAATKRLVMEFEAALARAVRTGRVDDEIDGILERFLVEDYVQHTPGIGQGRAALGEWFRRGAFGGDPPPPVALIVEGDLVAVLMVLIAPDQAVPDGTQEVFVPTVFRVRDGRLCEHWGLGVEPPAPPA